MSVLKSFTGIESKLKQKIVDVPEIEDEAQIIIREMSGKRMMKYQEAMKDYPDFPLEHMIIACAIDEEGNQIASHEDALSLSEMLPMEVSNRLFVACREVNASAFESIDSKKKK